MENLAITVDAKLTQYARKHLEKNGVWDKSRRLKCLDDGKVAIPVAIKTEAEGIVDQVVNDLVLALNTICLTNKPHVQLISTSLPTSRMAALLTPHHHLVSAVQDFLQSAGITNTSGLLTEIPHHWEKHGDLVLLPETCFQSPDWICCGSKLWEIVASCLGGVRVARKQTVSTDGFRTPQVQLLLGNSGWVKHVDNGIMYCYDVTKCMFSAGNITEKLRIAQFDCSGETVVDMYAGIGYFTLPYLVHAGAKCVHACDWNPQAIEALLENLKLNHVEDRCTVHSGDNREVCPRGVADRVNLGLIPSSEPGYRVGCEALRPDTGGILHIHGNVTTVPTKSLSGHACGRDQAPQKDQLMFRDTISKCTTKINDMCQSEPSLPCRDQSCTLSGRTNSELSQGSDVAGISTEEHLSESLQFTINNYKRGHTCDKFSSLPLQREGESDANSNNCCDEECVGNHSQVHSNQLVSPRHFNEGQIMSDGSVLCVQLQWKTWAWELSRKIKSILDSIHGKAWRTEVIHIEHVKSYAPHVDHLVVDLDCRPETAVTD